MCQKNRPFGTSHFTVSQNRVVICYHILAGHDFRVLLDVVRHILVIRCEHIISVVSLQFCGSLCRKALVDTYAERVGRLVFLGIIVFVDQEQPAVFCGPVHDIFVGCPNDAL